MMPLPLPLSSRLPLFFCCGAMVLGAGASGCTPRPGAAPPPKASGGESAVTQTYRLKATEHVRSPARLDELMGQYYDVQLLVQAQFTPGEGTLRLEVASPDASGQGQDLCAPTTTLAGIPLGPDRGFSVEGGALGFVTEGVEGRYSDLRIVGGMLVDDALLADQIVGVVDTAPMGTLLGSSDPGAVCSLLGAVLPCASCPEGGGATCWTVTLEGVRAVAVSPPLSVVPRSREAICADAACAGAPACAR